MSRSIAMARLASKPIGGWGNRRVETWAEGGRRGGSAKRVPPKLVLIRRFAHQSIRSRDTPVIGTTGEAALASDFNPVSPILILRWSQDQTDRLIERVGDRFGRHDSRPPQAPSLRERGARRW